MSGNSAISMGPGGAMLARKHGHSVGKNHFGGLVAGAACARQREFINVEGFTGKVQLGMIARRVEELVLPVVVQLRDARD